MSTDRNTPFEAPVVDHLSVRVGRRFPSRALSAQGHPSSRQHRICRGHRRAAHDDARRRVGPLAASRIDGGRAPGRISARLRLYAGIINRNFGLLNIDPARLSGLILSHGHRDHYGGLDGFVNRYRGEMGDDMSLYVAPRRRSMCAGFRRPAEARRKAHDAVLGRPGSRVAGRAGGCASLLQRAVGAPMVPSPPAISSAIRSKRSPAAPCSRSRTISATPEKRGELVFDSHPEEHATCYLVRGRGLVVISSCGHSGIVNSVRTAMSIAGTDRLHAVIGGFHLGMSKPEYIEYTIRRVTEARPRCRRPDALHRSAVHRSDAPPHAGATGALLPRHQDHLRRLTGTV